MTLFGYLQSILANAIGISKAVTDLKADADWRFGAAETNAIIRQHAVLSRLDNITQEITANQKELVAAFQGLQQDQMDDFMVLSRKMDALQATQQQILAALQPPQAVGTQIVLGAEQPQ